MQQIKTTRRQLLIGAAATSMLANAGFANAASVATVMRGDAVEWQGVVIDLEPFKSFYQRRLGNGVWTGTKGLNRKGVELVKLLQNADKDGLETADYISALPKNINSLSGKDLGYADLYLSQAFWRFCRDLSAGRTTPSVSEPDIIISRKSVDVADWLRTASRKGPKAVLDEIRPKHAQYMALRKILAKTKSNSAEARKIIVNMERWRWLPEDLGKKHVLVNQAAFEVMIREKEKTIDRRRVVVGKPYYKTPMFSHEVEYAEFNPTWTVPRSIASTEILPALRRNPGYLEKNNYKVYTSWDADAPAMNPDSVDWNAVSSKKFPYRIVQQPGDNNALGRVKIMFPNKFDVYLHDTQAKNLFAQKSRAFSHGCIRVEKPLEFVSKLFGRSLDEKKIDKILSDPQTQRVALKQKMPIHLTYFTAWVEKGRVKFHKDVYERDKLVGNILFGQA